MTQNEAIEWLPSVPYTAGASDAVREPGWYRHPQQPRLHRYWDGATWHPQGASRPRSSASPTGMALDSVPTPRPRTA